MAELDETHAPELASWVSSAQDSGSDFPLQNLPLGVFRAPAGAARIGIAIGSLILDLHRAVATGALGPLEGALREAVLARTLNPLFALGREALRTVRHAVHRLLRADSPLPRPPGECLVPARDVELLLPAAVGDYSDFYASIHHASNVGAMLRPEQPLLPNYKWIPIGYHGRASSLVPSGTTIRRPVGQLLDEGAAEPLVSATRALDYECEIGAWIAKGNALGVPVPIHEAEQQLAGLCLVNDWSARDIQRWEYQPLGPFLSKSFATSVSPWVVTLDALEPFRVAAPARSPGDPAPLPYLSGVDPAAFGIEVEVWLASERMRRAGEAPLRLSRGAFEGLYWTLAQLVAHHTSNGCNLRPGDLLASGTISGPERENRGCLLELTWRGRDPVSLPGGETRRFLEDGDEVILRGSCSRPGRARIGFGECRGVVVSAGT